MSYASDDLTPLFDPRRGPRVGHRRGIIRAWNSTTAANQVEVDGALVDNLPTLTTALAPGDVVSILTVGSAARSWVILGRIIVPAV